MSWDRICYVVPSLGVGGSERQLLLLMKELAHDYELLVVCTRTDGALAGDARRLGDVKVLSTWSGWDPRIRPRLERVLRAYRPAIVHSLMFGFDYPVNVAARRAGVPVVISSRRQLAHWKKPRHIRLQQRANRLVDAIVANSRAVADFSIRQEGADPSLVRVVHNGVDAERFRSETDRESVRRRFEIPYHTKVVGMVANFGYEKDHALFVDIAADVVRRRPDVHFILVGTGPLRDATERALSQRGIGDQVTILRTVAELPDLYRLMSVFLLCSRSEGFPNVVLEAMAAGKPVVASAVGGIPELIDDGVTGRLIRSRNPEEFAAAIDAYLENPDAAEAAGQRAASVVADRFSVQRMSGAYREIYAELLTAARSRRSAG